MDYLPYPPVEADRIDPLDSERAVLSDGNVVREWPVPHRAPHVDPPQAPAGTASSHDTWLRSVCGYLVMTPSAPERKPKNEGRAALWCVYEAENWH
ncbi:hypothetical protein ACIHCQ_38170 [Streptomyces sp. NPDC052236]|uniref:hypothetical protein n=1 Tax=Streptomyces sp. NPDC052236 TaxID=3365686 RepID=UPI0037D8AA8A